MKTQRQHTRTLGDGSPPYLVGRFAQSLRLLILIITLFVINSGTQAQIGTEKLPGAQALLRLQDSFLPKTAADEAKHPAYNYELFVAPNAPYMPYKSKIEELGKRDLSSKTFQNEKPGSFTLVSSAGECHFDRNGQLLTILNRFEKTDGEYQYIAPYNSFVVGLKNNGEIDAVLPNGQTFAGWRNLLINDYPATLSEPVQKSSDTLLYRNAILGIDAICVYNSGGYQVAYQAKAASDVSNGFAVTEKLVIPGMSSWKHVQGGIEIYDQDNKYICFYGNILGVDAKGKRVKGALTAIQNGEELVVSAILPVEWLHDSTRTFPVTLDPTVYFAPTASTQWTGTAIQTGYLYTDAIYAGFFDCAGCTDEDDHGFARINLSALPDNACISYADLLMLQNAWYNGGGNDGLVFDIGWANVNPVGNSGINIFNAVNGLSERYNRWSVFNTPSACGGCTGGYDYCEGCWGWRRNMLNENGNFKTRLMTTGTVNDYLTIGLDLISHADDCWNCLGDETNEITFDGWSSSFRPQLVITYEVFTANAGPDLATCSGTAINLQGGYTGILPNTIGTSSINLVIWYGSSYSTENSWSLVRNRDGLTIVSGGSCSCNNTFRYNGAVTGLEPGGYTLRLRDSYGDGWNGGGYFNIAGSGNQAVTGTGVDYSIVVDVTTSIAYTPTYSWSGPASLSGQTPLATTAGTYTLTVTANGCSRTDAMVLTVNPLPTATLGYRSCPGVNNTTTMKVIASGGSGSGYNYRVTTGSFGPSNTFYPANGSTNLYQVRDGNGCISSNLSYTAPSTPTSLATSTTTCDPCNSDNENRPLWLKNGLIGVAQINDNGNALGVINAKACVAGSPYLIPDGTVNGFTAAAQRSLEITFTQPVTPVRIVLPMTTSELNNLISASASSSSANDGVTSISDVKVTRLEGVTHNCTYNETGLTDRDEITPTANPTILGNPSVSFLTPGNSVYWLHGSASNTPLPIVMLSQHAQCSLDGVSMNIEWVTSTEVNNKHFTIERSSDGTDWVQVCDVDGAGNSNTTRYYSCQDTDPILLTQQAWYYRITQTDFDGTSETFPIMMAVCDPGSVLESDQVTVFPNPATDQTTIQTIFTNDTRIKMTVLAPNGDIVKTLTYQAGKGTTQVTLPTYDLPAGPYYLVMETPVKRITRMLVVTK